MLQDNHKTGQNLPVSRTLVFGASLKPGRYSNMAMKRLSQAGFGVIGFGRVEGTAHTIQITSNLEAVQDVDTITMYMRAKHQREFLPQLLALKPRRVIFNPGAEFQESYAAWESAGAEVLEACTLVMLATGTY
ncbi:CoA-binding protein [Robiginitalea sp. M366]|uniref:CoA-binding protein n=1 Tax=Robiginitalea aestuariiviva TaxID=3036903 RepID=UPI00240E3948|nr:CoA-binding protein [Robiginitalea aestuariiviva]MDG1573203.1 CoA-binding protein [Robiginitalea aestuariiviva]